jgi:hypothetical protein
VTMIRDCFFPATTCDYLRRDSDGGTVGLADFIINVAPSRMMVSASHSMTFSVDADGYARDDGASVVALKCKEEVLASEDCIEVHETDRVPGNSIEFAALDRYIASASYASRGRCCRLVITSSQVV